jgi:chemotaxis protein CheY-P-specific phosphatase CheC
MEHTLSKNELKTASQIIGTALLKARSSMEMILQTPINIQKIDFGFREDIFESQVEEAEYIYVIKTELMGELRGASHLLLPDYEVQRILSNVLPASVMEDESENGKIMRDGFLTELDNMVSAAVISSLSDLLDINFYGHVPDMQIIKREEVDEFIDSESQNYDTIIHFKAIFFSEKLDIAPHFMWMTEQNLIDKLKSKI